MKSFRRSGITVGSLFIALLLITPAFFKSLFPPDMYTGSIALFYIIPVYLIGVWLVFTVAVAITCRLNDHVIVHVAFAGVAAFFVSVLWTVTAYVTYAAISPPPRTDGFHSP